MVWDSFTWIFVCSIFMALFVAWGIGANDVANSFGTSVGAKALTLPQAIIVASFCEFGGAILLGSGVTDTIKSGIANISYYTYKPELLMYGMLCALLATGLWLALATFLELPVSTTHSIVGAIIGMSMIAAGPDSIIWTSPPKPGSPFPGGVVAIVLAWFITPAMAAVVASLLFIFTKLVVLRAKNPFRRALMLFPLYTFITVWVITYFVIQKGVNGWMKAKTYGAGGCPPAGSAPVKSYKYNADGTVKSVSGCTINDPTNAWISAVTAAVVTIICIACLKLIVKLVERDVAALEAKDIAIEARRAAKASGTMENGGKEGELVTPVVAEGVAPTGRFYQLRGAMHRSFNAFAQSPVGKPFMDGASYDIHESIADDEKLQAMNRSAEVFDVKSEGAFKYLQVLTACANSFAHGANDVANAIGSMAAVYAIWNCGCANSKANVPIWMFVIGGVGLILGLSTYGYKIMRALGVKMTKLTNSRGYCAELTSAIIVIVSSRYGFPVSTTQVITGAITGIGITEVVSARLAGRKDAAVAFNFLLLGKFFAGWVATLVVAGLTSAAFTAQGIYAPSYGATNYRAQFNAAFNQTNVGITQTLLAAGNSTAPTPAQAQAFAAGQAMNSSIVAWSTANNLTLLNSDVALGIFQQGTWALGNASLAGALTNVFQPAMPLDLSEALAY